MVTNILILQSDLEKTQSLTNHFTQLKKQVWLASTQEEAEAMLLQHRPELVVVDLHLLNNGWKSLVPHIRQKYPNTRLLLTTGYPDPQEEIWAKEKYGFNTFLRPPFTRSRIEQALHGLEQNTPLRADTATLPKVRVPVRMKIILPYGILALILALAAAYVVSQLVLDTVEERFTNQLIEAGKLATDWMVNEEDRMLESLRLVSHTKGLPQAVSSGNAEELRQIILPLATNYQEEAIEILDMQGTSILSLRHRPNGTLEEYDATRGESIFSQWTFVQRVLQQQTDQERDKYAGLARAPWGNYLYVSGPIVDDQGRPVGVVLVGKSLPTLVRQIRQDTLAHVTIYDLSGQPIVSTLLSFAEEEISLLPETVLQVIEQPNNSLTRPLQVASISYREIVGPWEIRKVANGSTNNTAGLMGASLAETFLVRPSQITRWQIFGLTAITFLLIIVLGLYVANRITKPLLNVVTASSKVAQGNLDVQVESNGDDEVAVLAHSFNHMVSGLREGSIYRDLLGRTVSPEVRAQLRQGFASGEVKLEGQEAVATVLVSDIRGFTTLSETESPTIVMNWLNEYFEEIVPVITSHGGTISQFEGDAVVAFFGLLPRPLSAQEGAYQACQVGLEILQAIERLNQRRANRGDSTFSIGIGINTGPVTAGALGSNDRLHYTIIGDTVNTTTRLESLTRQFGQTSNAIISQHTLFALRERRHEFNLEWLGAHNMKGKMEQIIVYQLTPTKATA